MGERGDWGLVIVGELLEVSEGLFVVVVVDKGEGGTIIHVPPFLFMFILFLYYN